MSFLSAAESFTLPFTTGAGATERDSFVPASSAAGVLRLDFEYTENEEHENVLKLILSFTEEAASRIMKIHFKANEILLELDETPGKEFISIGLKLSMSQIMNSHFIVKRALGSGADTIVNEAVMRKISPSTRGRLIENAEEN